jgi:hypothetical protein
MTRPTDLKGCSGCGVRFSELHTPIYGGPELEGHAFCDSACKFSYVIQELTRLRDENATLQAGIEEWKHATHATQVALDEANAKLDALPGLQEAALLAERFLREHPLAGAGIATVAQALRSALTDLDVAGCPESPEHSSDRAEAELASRPGWGGDS